MRGFGFLRALPAAGSQRRSWRILSLLTWKTAPIWSRVQPSSLSWWAARLRLIRGVWRLKAARASSSAWSRSAAARRASAAAAAARAGALSWSSSQPRPAVVMRQMMAGRPRPLRSRPARSTWPACSCRRRARSYADSSLRRRPGSARRPARAGVDSGSGFCASALRSRAGRVSAVAACSAAGMVTVWLSLIGFPSCPAAGLTWWLIAETRPRLVLPEPPRNAGPVSRPPVKFRIDGRPARVRAGPPVTPCLCRRRHLGKEPAANSPAGGPASIGTVLPARGGAGSSRRWRV